MSDEIRVDIYIDDEDSSEFSFNFTDIQRNKEIEAEDLRGRTIERIETNVDGEIFLTLEEVKTNV